MFTQCNEKNTNLQAVQTPNKPTYSTITAKLSRACTVLHSAKTDQLDNKTKTPNCSICTDRIPYVGIIFTPETFLDLTNSSGTEAIKIWAEIYGFWRKMPNICIKMDQT